jgi:ABC-2 type transport system permease protein
LGGGKREVNLIGILLKVNFLSLKNGMFPLDVTKLFRLTTVLGLGLGFLYLDYAFFLNAIRYLDDLPLDVGDELIVQLLNAIFLTLIILGLFSGFISSLSIFYLSSDLDNLHALPIKSNVLIISRLIICFFHSSWIAILFATPIVFAYGRYFQLPLGYYFFSVFSFPLFTAIPCFTGALGTLLLTRYFPAKQTHRVLSFLGIAVLVVLIVYIRFLSPEKFFGQEVSEESIVQFVENLKVPDFAFLPNAWLVSGMTAWVQEDPAVSIFQYGYFVLATVLCFVAFVTVGRMIYVDGWKSFKEAIQAPTDETSFIRSIENKEGSSRYWKTTKMLWRKDLKALTRDPTQWTQSVILSAIVAVYIFNIMNLSHLNIVLKNVISVLNIGLVGFVLAALVSRFVFPAISLEARSFWSIYTSPTSMSQFLMAKFCILFPFLLIVGEILTVVSNFILDVDYYVMTVSISAAFLISLGLTGLGLGMGAIFPKFHHENVSEITAGTGGFLFMIFGLSFVGAIVVLEARPLYVHFNQKFLLRSVGGLDVPVCYGLAVLLSILTTWIPLRKGIKILEKMDL